MKINNNEIKTNIKNKNINHKISKNEKKEFLREIGGPKGKEPTRYGDWEKNGRCSDF